jgi:hypothetical protein
MNKYHPWIGDNYGTKSLFGVPVLIVGESNYGEAEQRNDRYATRKIINNVIRKEWNIRFFSNIQRCFVEEAQSIESRVAFWNSVAHYEYLQHMLSGPYEQPQEHMWSGSRAAFEKVLRRLRPKCILFASKRLYQRVRESFEAGRTDVESLSPDVLTIDDAVATFIKHPTWYGFRKSRPRVRRMLKHAGGRTHL